MGKILTSIILAGAMVLELSGCTSGTNTPKTEEVGKITYEVTSLPNVPLVVDRSEYRPDSIFWDRSIEWTRYPTCCQKLVELKDSYFVWCMTDKGLERLGVGTMYGEELGIFNNKNGKDTIFFNDFDCDGQPDKISNSQLNQIKTRFESGTEELFKKADQLFSEYKKQIREGVNLELETQKWLDSRKKLKKGFFNNL